MKLLILITLIVLTSTLSVSFAEPQEIKLTDRNNHSMKHIGIEWSKTCESLMASGDLKTCSTKETVKSFYPDTKLKADYQKSLDTLTNDPQTIFKTNNYIHKQKLSCISKNYCDTFQIKRTQKAVFWFDPELDTKGYLDFIITIQPNMLDKNISLKSSPITDNGTNRSISFNTHDLFIDDSCRHAIINPNVIYDDLGKIIYYAINDCKNPQVLGKLKDNYTEPLSKHILDITTSHYWQAQQKMKADIERCKAKC